MTAAAFHRHGARDEHGRVSDLHHVLPPDLTLTQLPDEQVERAFEVIGLTGLSGFFELRLRPTPRALPDGRVVSKGGQCRTGVTPSGLLTAMLLVAMDGKAMHFNNYRDVLHHRLSPEMRLLLGVARTVPDQLVEKAAGSREAKARDHREARASVKQIERLFHAMIAPIDPSPFPKNKVLTKEALQALAKPLTPREIDRRQLLLDWVTGRILEATWLTLTRPVRRAWKGSVGHDATYVGVWARGRSKKSKYSSTDPDAGYYVRYGDHRAPDDVGGRYHKDGTPKSKFGYDAEIAVIGADDPADERRFPLLALGFRLHKPGVAPGPNCIAVLHDVTRRHLLADPGTGVAFPPHTHPDGPAPEPHPTGLLGADRAYNGSVPSGWVLPARALGYEAVFDYKIEDLGHQGEHQGAVLVDGTWYSPSIKHKPALVNATLDLLAGRIDVDQHARLIATRREHALRTLDRKKDANGHPTGVVKHACQASGRPGAALRPTVECAAKTASLATTGTFDKRPVMLIPISLAGEGLPAVCTQQSVTFGPDVLPKHQQALPHQSPQWQAVYGTLRNTIESTNSTAKDTSKTPIEQGDRRRVRGIAANSLVLAFLLAARNLLKITTWYKHATWNGDGSMTDTRRKAKRSSRPALDDFHPDKTGVVHDEPGTDPPAYQPGGPSPAAAGDAHAAPGALKARDRRRALNVIEKRSKKP